MPIGDLPADQAAPLSDAGLTSYHAVAGVRHALGDGTTAAVIGVGGLGHLAVQILRATTPSRVLAVDIREEALALAHRCGAHFSTLLQGNTAHTLRAQSSNVGADAVLDFVGNAASLELAVDILRPGGELAVVGSGGGHLTVRKPGVLPSGFRLSLPFWGSRHELVEAVALARSGALHVDTEQFPLSAAAEAFARLRQGQVRGGLCSCQADRRRRHRPGPAGGAVHPGAVQTAARAEKLQARPRIVFSSRTPIPRVPDMGRRSRPTPGGSTGDQRQERKRMTRGPLDRRGAVDRKTGTDGNARARNRICAQPPEWEQPDKGTGGSVLPRAAPTRERGKSNEGPFGKRPLICDFRMFEKSGRQDLNLRPLDPQLLSH
ncbi:zinc-binding dehydrogenase [Streptomyces sp. F001]|uniref:zinc-binding dehydrogenase n=1 Tax=Streptomyces sp. F001 TaxID=1510026 RepID=UPI001F0D6519|nr:zinc-binding dehydrogenase [Streptomyces sp. F001]